MEKINPDEIRKNLILASLYITSFDLLEVVIKEHTKNFVTISFMGDEQGAEEQYRRGIVDKYPFYGRNRKRYYDDYRACSLWLQEFSAINEVELETLLKIRSHRNEVVHELPRLLIDDGFSLNEELFKELQRLYKKIALFWARIDIDTNSDFDGQEIKDEEIQPGSVILAEYILSVFIEQKE